MGSEGNGVALHSAINQIIAPKEPVALIRGYASNLNESRVVTVNSVPFNIQTAPYGIDHLRHRDLPGRRRCVQLHLRIDGRRDRAGYNDVTGLGVPWVPKLINEE